LLDAFFHYRSKRRDILLIALFRLSIYGVAIHFLQSFGFFLGEHSIVHCLGIVIVVVEHKAALSLVAASRNSAKERLLLLGSKFIFILLLVYFRKTKKPTLFPLR
jgi:hypothetical protein